ncbi:MAG: MopE-related protein [Myxococcota bacterium]|nr:MopE-related protein [Myxococcota bacterium]
MHLTPVLWLVGCLSTSDQHAAYRDALKDQDSDGYDSIEYGGEDCDDSDARVYPGASDRPYDGLDADCAGDDDYDADSDGYRLVVYGGQDCDDEDDEVHPAALEVCGDGRDNDCDGGAIGCGYEGEISAVDAARVWEGEVEGDRLGELVRADGGALAWLYGGADGDARFGWVQDAASLLTGSEASQSGVFYDELSGLEASIEHADMVLGDFGGDQGVEMAVSLQSSAGWHGLDRSEVFVLGSESGGPLSHGHELLGADSLARVSLSALKGSQADALVVSACGEMRLWLLSNSLEVASLEQGVGVEFESGSEMLGCTVRDAGDMDGDGLHELAVGDRSAELWVIAGEYLGEEAGVLDVSGLAWRVRPGESTGHFGAAVSGLGDIDGDGRQELGIGMPCGDVGGCDGRVFLLGDDLQLVFSIVDSSDQFGSLLAGGQDATGDAVPDLLVGIENEQVSLFPGQVYEGTVAGTAAVGRLSVSGLQSVCLSPDLDENGLAELFVGAPASTGWEERGQALLFVAPGL